MRYSKEQVYMKFQKLPTVVQDVIFSSNTTDTIKEISKKYNLHIDKIGILNKEITYIIVGLEKTTDFIRNIKVQLNLPDEKINAIAKDVNEKIFLQVREVMKKAQSDMTEESGSVTPSSNKQVIDRVEESREIMWSRFPTRNYSRMPFAAC